jgi:toxin YoeB
MKLIFVDESWEDYLYWQKTNKQMMKKINNLIKDIVRNPYSGIGKPELLKFKYQGYWSRRIDQEHRLINRIVKDEIWIAKCRHHYD